MKTKVALVIFSGFMLVLSIQKSYSQAIGCQTPEQGINSAGEFAFNRYVVKFKEQGKHLNTDLKIIPVIIHVIYRDDADRQRISLARIVGQIDVTNKQLRRLNENAKDTRAIFLPVAADCNIQVCLAAKKPDRSHFDGVIYHEYPQFDHSRDFRTIQAATILQPDKYLNVWVIPGGEAGSATYPWEKTSTRDGFFIGSRCFGTIGDDLIPYLNGGTIFTHELGHFLGLDHTFHNGSGYPGQCELANDGSIGDYCADTPLDFEMTGGGVPENCNDGIRQCNTPHEGELITQSENFMYYNPDRCTNMFSKDQRARMRACLNQLRKELVSPSSPVFTGVDCDDLRRRDTRSAVPFAFTEIDENDNPLAGKPALKTKIAISPNPVKGMLHITYNGLAVHNMSLMLYNQMGQKLREVHSNAAINELNLGSFSEGGYYLRITIDNRSITKYIIKAKF